MMKCPSKTTNNSGLEYLLLVLVVFCVCGCGEFFAHKPTELRTREILSELREIKENPNIKNPLPELYREPPKIMKAKEGVKLFYFTKHHTVDKLSKMIKEQFTKKEVGTDGKKEHIPGYAVSENTAANQLIVQCPAEEEANKILEFLDAVDVPPIQVNIDCLILERFADVTMDWETTIKIENLLGEKITMGGKTDSSGNLLPAFPGASLRESKRSTFGLDFGYWKNKGVTGHEIRAVVDILVSRGYLKILMNPTIETVNGRKGMVTLRDYAPIEKIVTPQGVDPYSLTEYQWVADMLEVTPHVFADGSIGLATKIQLGSKSKPEGVVQTSIITERTAAIEENRIKPGDSLYVAGIRKSEERAVVRGVPLLKDIPVIGILFSSKDFEEKSTEVIFILTPSISSGGVKYTDVVEDIRRKMAKPEYEAGLHEALTDPFGKGIYTEQIEQLAAKAEFERFKAELEKADAIEEVSLIKEKLLDAAEEVLAEKSKVAQAQAQVQAATQEAQKIKAEAEAKAKAEADARAKAEAEAQQAKAEVERLKNEADAKAKAEAEAKAKAEAEAKAKKAEQPADEKTGQ